VPCPDCATPTAPGARFCHQCGRSLGAAPNLRVGDRRVVTAVFADLVGYTRLVDELDPEEVRARVDEALAVLSDAVLRFGGALEKFVGDAVLAVFGAPEAHDDDPLRACLGALGMQTALARIGEGGDRPLKLRVGIATGEVVAATRDLAGFRSVALTGECMTTAARLQQMAEPGEVLLDEATVRSAEPRVGADLVGERLLRVQGHPIAVYRLRDERRRTRNPGGGIRLVGRDGERQRLVDVIERTARTGHGGAVLITGEPGIGKSRLLLDMESAARAAGFAWMWIDNAPHLIDSPYRGVRAMVDWLADEAGVKAGILGREMIFGTEMDAETARLVQGAVSVLANDSEMLLLPEEGWAPQAPEIADAAELLAGLRIATDRYLSHMVAEKPRVVVIDDFHWLDPSSRVLMDEMVRISAGLPLVVLAGTRPPLTPDWVGLSHVEVIELGGLTAQATEELGMVVGGAELEADSAHWLYQRTAGNPLFIGEIMRTLRVGQRISRVGDRLKIDRAAAQRSVPLSLRALLGARIDALPPGPRACLEVASVIGVTFDQWLLAELQGGDVESDLGQLAAAGILTRCDDESDGPLPLAGGSGQWRFRHQLFHDAAYGRLLTDRKHKLHTALADRLEAVGAPVEAAELARHRMAAGDVARAIPLLDRAAAEAGALGALTEAEGFRQAAETLRTGR
jgi:class 3 adenylate cyclase